MEPQYNAIGARYVQVKELPIVKYIETPGFQSTVSPFLKNARVLDLACGTGFYSRLMLKWGASKVVGVDLSPAMIEVARKDLQKPESDSLTYHVGDATTLGALEAEGPFDLVTGVWLLGSADNKADLTKLWQSISNNLQPGGVFVGITQHPTDDLEAFIADTVQRRFGSRFGIDIEYGDPVPSGEGYFLRLTPRVKETFSFEASHLRKSIIEAAARAGGMKGDIEWRLLSMSDEGRKIMGEEFAKECDEFVTEFGVIIVYK